MKTLGYVWKIIVNIVTVFVVVSVFSIASTSFETAVLAILVLIYVSVNSFSSVYGLSTMQLAEGLDGQFEILKKLIKKDPEHEHLFKSDFLSEDEEDNYAYKKEIENNRAKNKKALMIKFYINAAFQFIIYVIALYYLFLALG